MNLILISPAGGGKDTLFSCLPQNYRRYAFGDNIRLVARNLRINGVQPAYSQLRQMFDLNPPPNLLRKLEEFRRIPQDTKDRKLLQELGTYCRCYDDYIWIRPIAQVAEYQSNMCITDCRRTTEFNSFPKFTSVYINTPYELRLERLKERDGTVDELALKHKAEQEIESLRSRCTYTIDNSGTLEDLKRELSSCLGLDLKNI